MIEVRHNRNLSKSISTIGIKKTPTQRIPIHEREV
jgi:hypothetical protein